MMRIAIAGIGGVGGFFGGLLARHYAGQKEAEIFFFARGAHLASIREQGLELQTPEENFTVKPFFASDNPLDFGRLDLIVFCTKTYSLEETARHFAGTIHPGTILLPLLNGVDSYDLLQRLYPQNKCLYGCTYLVAKIIGPGRVQQNGKVRSIVFGHPSYPAGKMLRIEKIFRDAGIDAKYHSDVLRKCWEKFCFIAPVATLTSAENKSLGEILSDTELKSKLVRLAVEAAALAKAKKIPVTETMPEQVLSIAAGLPPETTSSMQHDFVSGKQTELESLTGYVVRESRESGLPCPEFSLLYESLRSR